MSKNLAFLAVFVLSAGLLSNAYAHTSEVIGDYKVEVGWIFEPPVAGMKNAVEITITKATAAEKDTSNSHSEYESGKSEHGSGHETMMDGHKSGDGHSCPMQGMHNGTCPMMEKHGNDGMTHTSDMHADHEKKAAKASGIAGLGNSLEVDVTLNNEKTFLKIIESKFRPGVYYGVYVPDSTGFPLVHVVGDISGTVFEVTFHPERIEGSQ